MIVVDDLLVERVIRGDATADERAAVEAWRATSAEHERSYRQLVTLVSVARTLGSATGSPASSARRPTAVQLLAESARRERLPASPRRSGTRWVIRIAVAAAATVAAVMIGQSVLHHDAPIVARAGVATGVDQVMTLRLDDGSVVQLAPQSRLRQIPRPEAREVVLDGRAYFAVTRRPGRPFFVRTQAGSITVLGTRFEVDTRAESLHVTVDEGAVSLAARGQRVKVSRGEQARVAGAGPPLVSKIAVARAQTGWATPVLLFDGTPFRTAMRDVARTYGIRVSVVRSDLDSQTISATFVGQRSEEVVAALCAAVNAQCTTTDDTVVVSK